MPFLSKSGYVQLFLSQNTWPKRKIRTTENWWHHSLNRIGKYLLNENCCILLKISWCSGHEKIACVSFFIKLIDLFACFLCVYPTTSPFLVFGLCTAFIKMIRIQEICKQFSCLVEKFKISRASILLVIYTFPHLDTKQIRILTCASNSLRVI